MFGAPLGDAQAVDSATEVLGTVGLSCLADQWTLRLEDGRWITVRLVEAGPDRLVVANVDFGYEGDLGEASPWMSRWTIAWSGSRAADRRTRPRTFLRARAELGPDDAEHVHVGEAAEELESMLGQLTRDASGEVGEAGAVVRGDV